MVLGVAVLLWRSQASTTDSARSTRGSSTSARWSSLILVRVPGIGSTDSTGTAQRWFRSGRLQITPVGVHEARDHHHARRGALRASGRRSRRCRTLQACWSWRPCRMVLVFIQPDIGTTIVIVAIVVGMLVVAGTKLRHLLVLSVVGIVAIVLVFQRARSRATSSSGSPRSSIRRACPPTPVQPASKPQIAVGAGRSASARATCTASQTNLDFVPEQHTDFIFTVAGEEFGFVGALRAAAVRAS